MATTDPLNTTTAPATGADTAPVLPPFAALSPASTIPHPEPDRSQAGALPPLSDAELERQALQHPGEDGDPVTPE